MLSCINKRSRTFYNNKIHATLRANVVFNRSIERYRMNKKFLALALLTVAIVNARPDQTRTWGTDKEDSYYASAPKAYGLATIAGAALGLLKVGPNANIYEMGKGALVGILTVNGWTILVRETADPEIVNEFAGKVIKYGGAAIVAGYIGNAVWNSVFTQAKRS